MELSFLKKEKTRSKECFLTLDFGTEELKALLFREEKGKIIILGNSCQCFEQTEPFGHTDFEKGILKKSILKAIKEVQRQAKEKPNRVLLGLPANILRGRLIFLNVRREKPKEIIDKAEAKQIFQIIFSEIKKRIAQIFSESLGFLPRDLQFVDWQILEIKINGYEVPKLEGYNGENLEFGFFVSFIAKGYLENFKKIIGALNLKIHKIVHLAPALSPVFGPEKPNGLFFDIGEETSHLFLLKNEKLKAVGELEVGVQIFTRAISQALGIPEKEAQALKGKYIKSGLSEEVRRRIKEIFAKPAEEWFLELKSKFASFNISIPLNVYLFGEGVLIPEIRQIFEEHDWEKLAQTANPQVKIIDPKDLKNIDDRTGQMTGPSNIPAILICFGLPC